MMWYLILYSPWSFEKVEQKLEKMEAEGHRLVKVRFFWWFYFVDAKAKNVHYVLTYNFPKEFVMNTWEQRLKTEYNADPLDGGNWFYTSIFRIPKSECELTEFKTFRQQYLRVVCMKKLLICLFFFMLSMFASIYALIHSSIASGESVAMLVVGIISFICMLYYFYGVWFFSKKNIRRK